LTNPLEPIGTMKRRTTMKSKRINRLVAGCLATAVVLAGCSTGAADSDPESREPAADTPPIGPPAGSEYYFLGSGSRVDLRPGESRMVTVSLNSVGTDAGIWTVRPPDLTALLQGVTLSSVLPDDVDFTNDRTQELEFELTVPAEATPGSGGSMSVGFTAPAPSDPSRRVAFGGVSVSVTVVAADAILGPIATRDSVGAPAEGITFDPLANDGIGDAPLDPATLSIVKGPSGAGSLMITGDAMLTYTPRFTEGDVATYQICDTNGLCDTTQISLWGA